MRAAIRLCVLVLSGLAATTTALSAPTPAAITVARQHIEGLESLASKRHRDMVRICEKTVAKVRRLDQQGAADDSIDSTGDTGLRQIDRTASKALSSVRSSTSRTVRLLERLGPDHGELINQVNAAAEDALESVEASVVETKAPIVSAVDTATSN